MNKFLNSNKFNILKSFIFNKIPYFLNDLFLIILFSVIDVKKNSKNLVIVSGSDYTHFESTINLFKSLYKYENNSNLVFYDLGLNELQKKEFKEIFKKVTFVPFDFSSYPKFLSERDSDNKLGWYGWKPLIIKECIEKYKCNTLWLDSGCIITKKLNLIRKCLSVKGIYVALSVGRVKDWTHETSIKTLEFPNYYLNKKNFAGGLVGFNPNKTNSMKLLNNWSHYSMKKNALYPNGSSRKNHRQDQSILTMLIYISKLNYFITKTHNIFGIRIHNDPNKIYIWPSSEGNFVNYFQQIDKEHFTNTYKNATFVIFNNFRDLKKINSICKKNQKIIFASDKIIDSKTKKLLNKHIESGLIYKYLDDFKNLNVIELIIE